MKNFALKIIDKINWYYVLIGFGVLLVIGSIMASIEETKRWNKFKKDHECHVIERVSSSTSMAIVNGEYAVIDNPGSATWLCNDGVKYTRGD